LAAGERDVSGLAGAKGTARAWIRPEIEDGSPFDKEFPAIAMRPTRISCALRPHCYTWPDLDLDIAAPSSRKWGALARQEGFR